MADAAQFNADQLAFWNGQGGRTWVLRQAHTDIILAPVSQALLDFAAPRRGETVVDIGCGCGATTLEFARAVGPSGKVTGIDISAPMLAEAHRRAAAEGIDTIDWLEQNAATAQLAPFDLLVSAFGLMFFGDPVAAFANLRRAAAPGARLAFLTWRPLEENPWMNVPMQAALRHLPPRPAPNPLAPGMFALSDPDRIQQILLAASWTVPRIDELDLDLDIAAAQGLEEAVVQSSKIGAINSWLRDQPAEIVEAATVSIRSALADHQDGEHVRLPAAMWLVSSAPA